MVEVDIDNLHRIMDYDSEFGHCEAEVLKAAALWYSGAWFEVGDWWYNIGYQKPPSMRVLLGCRQDAWKNGYQPAIERLQDAGLLKERYIMRRKCKWAPTQAGRSLMGSLFAEAIAAKTPLEDVGGEQGWYDEGEEPEALVGDWNESLLHRTGVETTHTRVQLLGWDDCTRYPGDDGTSRPDIHALGKEPGTDIVSRRLAVEVLTNHNNHTIPERKYRAFSDLADHVVVWIFEDRKHAFQTLNRLHRSDDVDCNLVNAPYQNPENYPISVGREYIFRSERSDDHRCPGIDEIGTITGRYEDEIDEETLRELVYEAAPGFEDHDHGPTPDAFTV